MHVCVSVYALPFRLSPSHQKFEIVAIRTDGLYAAGRSSINRPSNQDALTLLVIYQRHSTNTKPGSLLRPASGRREVAACGESTDDFSTR